MPKEPKPNDMIPHNIHGHRIVEEYTKEGVIVSVYEMPKEGAELGSPLVRYETWKPGEKGLADAIQFAKQRLYGTGVQPNIEGIPLTQRGEEKGELTPEQEAELAKQ
jgi:hypothetical protein